MFGQTVRITETIRERATPDDMQLELGKRLVVGDSSRGTLEVDLGSICPVPLQAVVGVVKEAVHTLVTAHETIHNAARTKTGQFLDRNFREALDE